jgi:hypothetical protein
MTAADPRHISTAATLPPELRGTVPRDVQLTALGKTVAAIAVATAAGAFVAAIWMSIVYLRIDAERHLRDRESVSDTAEVVEVALRRGEHPRRVVTYRYESSGHSYTGQVVLREKDRRDVSRGMPIAIEYLPSRPEASWLAGDRPSALPIVLIPLTALGLLAVGAMIARTVRRQWILLSEGRAALASVTGFKKVHREHKHKAYRVSYEFQTLSGARQRSRCEIGKAPPPIGTMMPIVYHRDQPTWSATYPLAFVQPFRRR